MAFFKSSKVFLLLAILTLLPALYSVKKRINVENANHSVLLVAESETIQSLAAAQSMTLDDALTKLQKMGLNGIVLPEETIDDILTDGKVQLNGMTVQKDSPIASMTFDDPATVDRVVKGLSIRFGALVQSTTLREGRLALPPIDTQTLRATSIGINPQLSALAQKHHLTIVGRYSNPTGITSQAVTETIKWAKDSGVSVFLPQGDQVLGRRDALDTMKDALVANQISYASPEFAKIGGDEEMLRKIPEHVVRLHSAQAVELDKLSTDAALDRYLKAAKERDMRVLLLRPLSQASDAPLDSFGDFIGSLSDGLSKKGLTLGDPAPFTDPNVPKPVKVLIGIFGGLAALWVAIQMFGKQKGLVLGGLAFLGVAAGSALKGTGLEASALMLSMAFPIGGYYWLKETKPHALAALVGLAFLSVIGGFCVAGLMNSVPYYIRAETFSGVKISVFLPIFVIGLVAFADLNDLKQAMKDPITWGAAALGLVVLTVLGIIMMRTGNDSPNTVSGGELAFRGILEEVLPVRPRSKEFLLGFPALTFGLFVLDAAKYQSSRLGKFSGWVSLCIMLGFVGLTDSVNTLCHLHTPVMVSVWRDVIGLLFGAVIGVGAWVLFKKKVIATLGTENG
ncbi:MAG: hypothetical protein JST12_18865 [Armatimonadetes bacterium]|nr:hypothetical protein [Armatimonadota bacterium]